MTYCHNMWDTLYCYLSGKCQNRQQMQLQGLVITATLYLVYAPFSLPCLAWIVVENPGKTRKSM